MYFMVFLCEWNKFSLTVAYELMICLAGNDWPLDKADFFFFFLLFMLIIFFLYF